MQTIILTWRALKGANRLLAPGIGIKRWLLLLGVGAALIGIGLVYLILLLHRANLIPDALYDLLTLQFLPVELRMLAPLLVGAAVMLIAIAHLSANLIEPFRQPGETFIQSLYEHRRRGRGPRIVAIGGGTGLPNLLRGLTKYTRNITAIVTVADDGGSSGRLRRELGVLPPGDFRNNIAALSRDEALMTQVLQYRFGGAGDGQGDLQGHAFGNLLLAALAGVTGSFEEALLAAEKVLSMRGKVLPSTLDNVALVGEIETCSGEVTIVKGESAITIAEGRVGRVSLEPGDVRAFPAAVRSILQADIILIGPGSLYTSILPNLLVKDLSEALRQSAAPKIYICNLATQPGETDNYTVAEHVDSITQHVPVECLDLVLANDNLSISPDVGGGRTIFVKLVAPDVVPMTTADLVDESRPWRHDATKLASVIVELISSDIVKSGKPLRA